MIQLIPLLLIGVAAAAASYLIRTRQAQTLRTVSDEEFVKSYQQRFTDSTESVLKLKTLVAKHLALPTDKLAPDQTFKQLAKYTGVAGEYEVGMGDLESELSEALERAGLEPLKTFPNTIAEYIHEMLKANAKQASK
jgi:hypothetical protein